MTDDGDEYRPKRAHSTEYSESFFDSAYWAGIVASKINELEEMLKREAEK